MKNATTPIDIVFSPDDEALIDTIWDDLVAEMTDTSAIIPPPYNEENLMATPTPPPNAGISTVHQPTPIGAIPAKPKPSPAKPKPTTKKK